MNYFGPALTIYKTLETAAIVSVLAIIAKSMGANNGLKTVAIVSGAACLLQQSLDLPQHQDNNFLGITLIAGSAYTTYYLWNPHDE